MGKLGEARDGRGGGLLMVHEGVVFVGAKPQCPHAGFIVHAQQKVDLSQVRISRPPTQPTLPRGAPSGHVPTYQALSPMKIPKAEVQALAAQDRHH
jgi:hypothetical protein